MKSEGNGLRIKWEAVGALVALFLAAVADTAIFLH